ncbi:acetyl-CoA carboxylase biotin carboxyl carrier protein [Mechercharimyces sp. CAU 1602]|uniref:acetyl-CoA carboxylase biotin carboxyl carrier protein n=1 Tax=Mechercharimyces sp. CAU 1602 TaxID=2973933 RepID=UPI0021629C6D|nr:acetyl-CoA carboxylase biotin carboxyl carrier protein [Mechercharimyces sp. CAU 1602]MCS1350779.1 acetyl-CoA carboxylase biotin carboxyl carrier protein [Mechercharimyces sp. CAU 1602]
MPLRMHELRELIKLVDESQIEEFKLENEGTKIKIKKPSSRSEIPKSVETATQTQVQEERSLPPTQQENAVPVIETEKSTTASSSPSGEEKAPAKVESDVNLHEITSPMVGTFYRAPAPDQAPYTEQGSKVEETSVVCIIEAMKLMNEIEAEVRGEVVNILVENGQLVEYGQPLFQVKTTS